jgi:hypothetical protein
MPYMEEAEALAKETLTFKQLFAEIEQGVSQHPATVNTVAKDFPESKTSPTPAIEKNVPTFSNGPIVAEPPAYLQQVLSERATRRSRGWWLFAVIALFILVCGIGYYAVTGHDLRLLNLETAIDRLLSLGKAYEH